MQKVSGWIGIFVLFPSVLMAQTTLYSASNSDKLSAAPEAGIDLVKQSFAGSGISGTANTRPAEIKKDTKPAQEEPKYSPEEEAVAANASNGLASLGMVPSTNLDISLVPQANTPNSKAVNKNNSSTQTKVIKTSVPPRSATISAQDRQAQAELDYAARMLAQSGQTMPKGVGGRLIPQAASQGAIVPEVKVSANRPFNPNEFRPGAEWIRSNSTHFIIYSQKRDNGIGSSNMSMIFENAYATLRRNIPWMMAEKVRVFVYQDYDSYLEIEPDAKEWTRALAYPTRGEIVVYDEPGKQQELKEVFTHELVHVFTQKFFDKYKTGRLMTPAWLDEGLAVYIEDQAYNGNKGGPWANDLRTLNLKRDPQSQSIGSFGKSNNNSGFARKGKPVQLMSFDQFIQEGSLQFAESRNKTQEWYLQAYAMVRFLLNPSGGMSPSNRMQFEQFTRLLAQGEQVRDPSTGFPAKDANGKPIYQPYDTEKALNRAYHYNNLSAFEDAFWRWVPSAR